MAMKTIKFADGSRLAPVQRISRPSFQVTSAVFQRAWDVLWQANLDDRKRWPNPGIAHNGTYYLTAQNLEWQVRAMAEAHMRGEPEPTERAFSGYGFGGVRFRGDLQAACRGWLRSQEIAGKLQSHNFGRGHISGQRYRPRGEPLSAAERKTMEKHAKPRAPKPWHFSPRGYMSGDRAACQPPRGGRSFRPSKSLTTNNRFPSDLSPLREADGGHPRLPARRGGRMTLTERALIFATRAHSGQTRKYVGGPYIAHPVAVAAAVERAGLPPGVVAAALLHDVVEDCDVSPSEIFRLFGSEVDRLVAEVTEVSKPEDGSRAVCKAMDRDHFARASSWGQSIKLADVAHNSAGIVEVAPKFAPVYLREIIDLLRVLTSGDASLKTEARRVVGIEAKKLGITFR